MGNGLTDKEKLVLEQSNVEFMRFSSVEKSAYDIIKDIKLKIRDAIEPKHVLLHYKQYKYIMESKEIKDYIKLHPKDTVKQILETQFGCNVTVYVSDKELKDLEANHMIW